MVGECVKKILLLLILSFFSTQSLARGGGYGRIAKFFEDKIPPEVTEFLSPLGAVFTPTVFYVIVFLFLLGLLLYVLGAIILGIAYLFKFKPPKVKKNRGPDYKPKMMTNEEFDEAEGESKVIMFFRIILVSGIAYLLGLGLIGWVNEWGSFPSSWS
jgi:hypothetical protein